MELGLSTKILGVGARDPGNCGKCALLLMRVAFAAVPGGGQVNAMRPFQRPGPSGSQTPQATAYR
jgi:hypothetical protein